MSAAENITPHLSHFETAGRCNTARNILSPECCIPTVGNAMPDSRAYHANPRRPLGAMRHDPDLLMYWVLWLSDTL